MFRTKFNPALLGLLPAAFIFASAGIHAQTPPVNSTQPLPTPAQTSAAPVVPLNPALPTAFIVGDSTAHNQADLGWGDHLAHYFDTTRINVANRAIAGRSSRSFIREGAWDKVLAEMKPGDYMLLCGSANRAKSWSCEHCVNWLELRKAEICRKCYWAYPDDYSHVAMREARRADILWTGAEVESYDKLKRRTLELQKNIPGYVKEIIEMHLKGEKAT